MAELRGAQAHERSQNHPLLTIAVPTYNRSAALGTLLGVLLPQLDDLPSVELLVSDNASTDDTEGIMRDLVAQGAPVRYIRQPENLGSDRNFVECFEHARGTFFWLCGDDDVICPGALNKLLPHLRPEETDLVYVASYSFTGDYAAERVEDPLGRRFQTFHDAREFARVVNIMFTFISGLVVNRDRMLKLFGREPLNLLTPNLVQLNWSLPLLLEHRRSVVLWDRALAGRVGNAGGYDIGKVFGTGLRESLARLLPGRDDLQEAILNPTLRRWLPSVLYGMRRANNARIGLATAQADFARAYGGNPRFWMFAYPVLRLPLLPARLWLFGSSLVSHAVYVLTVPRFWRKEN